MLEGVVSHNSGYKIQTALMCLKEWSPVTSDSKIETCLGIGRKHCEKIFSQCFILSETRPGFYMFAV